MPAYLENKALYLMTRAANPKFQKEKFFMPKSRVFQQKAKSLKLKSGVKIGVTFSSSHVAMLSII